MKKHIFVTAILTLILTLGVSTFAFAINMTGTWTFAGTWTDPDNGQSYSDTIRYVIENHLTGSNDFVGKIYDSSNVLIGSARGRIIEPSAPYTRRVMLLERIDTIYNFYAMGIGHVQDDTHINNGRWVDTFGNVGSFVMTKQN